MIKKSLVYFLVLLCLTLIVPIFNLSKVSITKSPLGEDLTPPGPAQYIESPEGKTTTEDKISFEGLAEANSTVKILVNDNNVAEIPVGENAKFQATVPLSIGENKIALIVVDRKQNIGESTKPVIVLRK